jgi:hypothetical protein
MAWGCNDISLLLFVGSHVLFALSFGYSTTFFFYLYFLSLTGPCFAQPTVSSDAGRAQRRLVIVVVELASTISPSSTISPCD